MSRNHLTVDDDTLVLLEEWRNKLYPEDDSELSRMMSFGTPSWNVFLRVAATRALEEDSFESITSLAERVAKLESRLDDEE